MFLRSGISPVKNICSSCRLQASLTRSATANANRIPLRLWLAEPYLFYGGASNAKTHPLGAFALRNFAFGEYLLVLPLTSELDALCDGKCEPVSALPSARGTISVLWWHLQRKNAPIGCVCVGGATRNRPGDRGVADLCLTAWP